MLPMGPLPRFHAENRDSIRPGVPANIRGRERIASLPPSPAYLRFWFHLDTANPRVITAGMARFPLPNVRAMTSLSRSPD